MLGIGARLPQELFPRPKQLSMFGETFLYVFSNLAFSFLWGPGPGPIGPLGPCLHPWPATTKAEEFPAGSRPLSHHAQGSNIPFGHLQHMMSYDYWVREMHNCVLHLLPKLLGTATRYSLLRQCYTQQKSEKQYFGTTMALHELTV